MNEADGANDFLLKCVVVGDSGVGKTSIIIRYADDTYTNQYTTIITDYKVVNKIYNDKKIKLYLWDTAGQERFRTITSSLYRGTHIVLITFDVTDIVSYNNIPQWLRKIDRYCPEYVTKIIVGNKIDLLNKRVITLEDARNFALESECEYIEVSALNGENIEKLFDNVLYSKFEGLINAKNKSTITLSKTNKNKKSCACK